MAQKKSFGAGLTSLLGGAPATSTQRRQDRQPSIDPKADEAKEITQTSTRGKGRPRKTDGSKGAYFVVDAEQLAKVQTIARANGLQIKQVLGKALSMFLDEYEKKHGVIEPTRQTDIDELI